VVSSQLRILSLGAGVQSTTLALLSTDGTLPPLDAAIFADTGWEPPQVYAQLGRISAHLATFGVPVHVVTNGNLRDRTLDPNSRFASIPYYTLPPSGKGPGGMGRRQCTKEYKLYPIQRRVRQLLGAAAPKYRTVPKGNHADQLIGFSTDELGRVRSGGRAEVRYMTRVFPLLDLGMSRTDCIAYLDRTGWSGWVKSACIGCPFHGNAQWRDLRDHHPEQWADAVAFDEAIRHGGASAQPLDGTAYLHRSRVPLSIAPIDRITRNERDPGQLDLFEGGDPDGCSPYACRSGAAVT
jgi:hypothetical protein